MGNAAFRPEPSERIVYTARRHWIALLLRSLLPVLAGAAAAVVFVVRALGRSADPLGRPPPLLDALNIMMLLAVIACAGILAYVYVDWRNDLLIVTNMRVVHEDRTLWLAFRFETIPIERIQNVNVRTENPLQYVLKYGRAEIQAAGPTAPIVFQRVESPAQLQRSVMAEVNRQRREQEQQHLNSTVQRRLRPDVVAPAPPLDAAHTVAAPAGLLGAVLPLGPQRQGTAIVWHRHWIVLAGLLLWPLAGLALWMVLFWALVRYDLFAPATTAAVLFVLLLLVVGGLFWQFENWRNDVYVLEPTKIIDVQRLPLGLFEDRREATLGVIQNINATSPNILARVFGYGDVLIETAGLAGNFTFDHVPDPDQVQRIVFEYQERFRRQQQERDWNNTLNIMEQYLRAQAGDDSP